VPPGVLLAPLGQACKFYCTVLSGVTMEAEAGMTTHGHC